MITDKDHDHPGDGVIKVGSIYVDPLNLAVEQVAIEDIARSLSHICRYGGHVPVFYSVAEHSLHVAAQVERCGGLPELVLAALLHDASEAYLGDMVRPLKHISEMEAYRAAEDRATAVIAEAFRLDVDLFSHPLIKEADDGILAWEMAMVRDAPWRPMTNPELVRYAFLARARDLAKAAGKRLP